MQWYANILTQPDVDQHYNHKLLCTLYVFYVLEKSKVVHNFGFRSSLKIVFLII